MKLHYNYEKCEYLIHNTILEADVIIDLAKPKINGKQELSVI